MQRTALRADVLLNGARAGYFLNWGDRRGLNLHLPGSQPGALPN